MTLIPAVTRHSRRGKFVTFIIGFFLCVGILLRLFPVYWMLISSVKGDVGTSTRLDSQRNSPIYGPVILLQVSSKTLITEASLYY